MRVGNPILAVVATAILSALLLAPMATANADAVTPSSVVAQLVGGWSLASRVTTTADGKMLSDPGLSATPRGVLIYDRYGHVAAQLSRPGRTVEMLGDECREAEKVIGTNDTAQTILGYDAYFGTYAVDANAGIVTHHLDSALFPGDIGKDIKREFSISGDSLTIKFHTTLRDGTPVVRTLVWTRMK
jgi:Lipocalin-like domain